MNSVKDIQNPFTYRVPVIKLAVKKLRSPKFHAILLVSMTLVGFFSLATALPLFHVGSESVVEITLYAHKDKGWNFIIPGPTITVNQGSLVKLTLISADGNIYNFFVDYNGDTNPSPGEPISPDFNTNITYQFTAYKQGSFTYYCQYYKKTMYGTFRVGIIRSTGQISIPTPTVIAASGYWQDIQKAVDAAAAYGIANVYIPEGTFNFVNVGESWTGARVNIPAGVNLFGAPTEKDSDGQVIEWKTILRLPWEVPSFVGDPEKTWFQVNGNEDPNKPSRFSDIKLVGWRYEDPSSVAWYIGLKILKVLDFRVDHCHFQDLCRSAIVIGADATYYNTAIFRGVVDHCRLVNTYGNPGVKWEDRSLAYGIAIRRWACAFWDYELTNIIGQYTNYTVFIENNYFSKWRHCVCSNHGVHYVFRYNIVEEDYGLGSVDAHGSYADDSAPYAVGTRAWEVYNNTFKDPDTTWYTYTYAINHRGGSGIFFNNTLIGYYGFCDLNNDWGNYEPYCPQCFISQTYIWNNDLGGAVLIRYNSDNTLNVHYFLRAPNLADDGFEYESYPYPHPLTLEGSES